MQPRRGTPPIDPTKIEDELGWSPSVPLRDGLERTYEWIFAQVEASRT